MTAFGVEMQQVLASTTGQPAAFVVGISGVFGGTRFALGADSMASLEDSARSSKPTPGSPSSWRRPETCSYPGPEAR